jgi:hypothetical protein
VLEQQGKEMMAGGVCERVAAISLIAVLLQLAGLTLFVLGFFPVKPALMGIRYVCMYVCAAVAFFFPQFCILYFRVAVDVAFNPIFCFVVRVAAAAVAFSQVFFGL